MKRTSDVLHHPSSEPWVKSDTAGSSRSPQAGVENTSEVTCAIVEASVLISQGALIGEVVRFHRLLFLLAALGPVPGLQAQSLKSIASCPVADSLLGKPKGKLLFQRDKLTDSLFLYTPTWFFGVGMSGTEEIKPAIVLRGLSTDHVAELVPVFHLTTYRMVPRGETISEGLRFLGDSIHVLFLLDDTLRISLGPMIGKVRLSGSRILTKAGIGEDYWWPIGEDQLLAIARSHKGVIGVGRRRSSIGGEFRNGIAAILRVRECDLPWPK